MGTNPHGLACGIALFCSPSASVVLACGFVGFGFSPCFIDARSS